LVTKVRFLTGKWVTTQYYSSWNGSSGSFPNYGTLYWDNSFTGVDNPYWRAQVSQGSNATTSASGWKASASFNGDGICEASYFTYQDPITGEKKNPDSVGLSGDFIPMGINESPWPSLMLPSDTAESKARLKYLSDARQARTAFQGGTFFGELSQTLRMLRTPAQSLRNGISSYVADAKKQAARKKTTKAKNKVVAGTWLEYNFGWLPLASDIEDAARAVSKAPTIVFRRIQGSGDTTTSSSHVDISGYGYAQCRWEKTIRVVQSVRYLGAVRCDNVTAGGKLENFGLSTENFLPTIWNLIPYSFLVDYFSNVGKIIDGASVKTSDIAWTCRTDRNLSEKKPQSCTFIGKQQNPWILWIHTNASAPSGSIIKSSFNRFPVNSGIGVSLSDLRFRIPGVEEPFKWLNIAALGRMRSIF